MLFKPKITVVKKVFRRYLKIRYSKVERQLFSDMGKKEKKARSQSRFK
jgi:hypothetical protein